MSATTTSMRDRRLLGISIVMFVAAGIIFGYVMYSQHRLASSSSKDVVSNAGIPGLHVVQISSTDREANITKAKRLRELFRPWALGHRPALIRMLNAQGDDAGALAEVYNALPRQPEYKGAGFNHQDLAAKPYDFTWNVGVEDMHLSSVFLQDPINRRNHEKTVNFQTDRRQKEYLTYHDVAISQAVNPGIKSVKLWASGRITETTLNVLYKPGTTMFDDALEQEIVPRYEFLY